MTLRALCVSGVKVCKPKSIICAKIFSTPEWGRIEVFLDQVKIENLDFSNLGFAAQKDEKKFAAGSAAAYKGFDQALPERAYFEFLERISLVDSKVDEEKTGSEFCYSKSNGI